jgi:hypothetical protein
MAPLSHLERRRRPPAGPRPAKDALAGAPNDGLLGLCALGAGRRERHADGGAVFRRGGSGNPRRRLLNDIKILKAHFVQVSFNGACAEGEVYLDRPGHLSCDYGPPTPVLIIANGLSLLYYDKEPTEATFLPLHRHV